MVLNLWVVTPFAKTQLPIFFYTMIHNSSKITVLK